MASPPDGPASFHERSCKLTCSAVAPGVLVARVVGELDYLTTPQLRRRLFDQFEADPTTFVVDLSDVRLLSASAMEMLLGLDVLGRARGCELRLVAASRAVRRPLALTGLDDRLRLFHTLDDALAPPAGPI